MQELKRFERCMSAIGVALFVVVSDLLGFTAKAQTVPLAASALLSLAGVTASYLLFRFVAEGLVHHCRWLRKALLGKRFIEGIWREIVIPAKKEIPSYVSITCIAYDHQSNSLRYSGENFTTDGFPLGTFKSDMVVLDWPDVKFKYTWRRPQPGQTSEGYGEFCLFDTGSSPRFYDGFFKDLSDGSQSVFLGWRVAVRSEARNLATALNDPKSVVDPMRKWADETKEYWNRRDLLQ